MFNFTTQTIVNDLDKRADLTLTDVVRVDNLLFKKNEIISIEKKLPSDEVLANVTFDIASLADQFVDGGPTKLAARVAFYIGLSQGSNDSFYANDLVYKGKPLYVEFPVTKDKYAEAATKLGKLAKQLLIMDNQPILEVEVSGTTVEFSAVNGYQIIREAALQVYDDSIFAIDCCNNEGGFKNVIEGVPVFATDMFKTSGNVLVANDNATWVDADGNAPAQGTVLIYPGAEAFCDYKWIMHNLRIPTCANTNYWSLTKTADELPVSNGKYIQYTIKMRTERNGIGGGVVGEISTSETTHVLYVLNTLNVSTLDTKLGAVKALSSTADTNLTA
jgi:hypothetical protein